MNNLKILLGVNIKKLVNKFRGKEAKKSYAFGAGILAFFTILIFVAYFFQAQSMFIGLGELGLNKICVFHGYLISVSTLIILAVMRNSGLMKTNDSEMLSSLPVKKIDIIISKTISLYFFDFVFALILILPYLVLYQIYEAFNLMQVVLGIISVLILPLFSVGITFVCDFITNNIFNKFKHSNMLKTVFSTFILVLVLLLLLLKTFGYGNVQPSSLDEYFMDRPIVALFLYATIDLNIFSILGIIALCFAPFAIGVALKVLQFGKERVRYYSNSSKLVFSEIKSGFNGIFKKETNFYLTTPAYLSNTIISPILMIVLSIMIATSGAEKLVNSFGVFVSGDILIGIIAIIFMGLCGMCSISASSISLEGKNFWIVKSSPVSLKSLFSSKILLNFITLEFAIIISSFILLIAMNLTFLNFLIVLILPSLMALFISSFGLFINLLFPKMEWDDPTKVVKQSMSVLLIMLIGFILTLLPIAIYLIFGLENIVLHFYIMLGVLILGNLLAILLLVALGRKLVDKITL